MDWCRLPEEGIFDRIRVLDDCEKLMENWIASSTLLALDKAGWITYGAIAGVIAFFFLYKQITGKDFVKSPEERRKWRRKRKHVIWEYRRDDD